MAGDGAGRGRELGHLPPIPQPVQNYTLPTSLAGLGLQNPAESHAGCCQPRGAPLTFSGATPSPLAWRFQRQPWGGGGEGRGWIRDSGRSLSPHREGGLIVQAPLTWCAHVPAVCQSSTCGTSSELQPQKWAPLSPLSRQGRSGSATENLPVTPSKSLHLSGSQFPLL